MSKILIILFFLFINILAVESTMGTFGYGRIQTASPDAKSNLCFKAPGAATKYRLGNECETWIELGTFQDLSFDNEITIHNQVLPVFSGANDKKIDFVRFEEAYSEISNLFDNSVSFWLGRRYYKRYDSFLPDYFFLNMSGEGAGINDLNLGELKLSYSYIFNNVNPTTVAGDDSVLFESHDLRLNKNTDRGELTLFLNYMLLDGKNFKNKEKIDSANGYAIGLIYKDTKISKELFNMDGQNISGFFYGKDLAKGAGTYSPYLQEPLIDYMIQNPAKSITNSQTLRFINYNAFEKNSLGIMSNFVYEYRDEKEFTNTKQNWISAGLRPYFFLNKYSRIVFEAGYDYVSDKISNSDYALTKLSTAFEISLDEGIFKRPVIRLFYTQAAWNNSSKGMVASDNYENKTSGNNLGVQIEHWW